MTARKKTKPMIFQRPAVNRIEEFGGRALLAMEPGLGKTYTSLYWLHRTPDARPIVIVCPASLKYTWQAECSRHFFMRAEILEGRKPPAEMDRVPPQIVILNYDILPGWVRWLRALKPKCIIADESQYITNRRAKRTKAMKELCRGIPHVLLLSGTPLTNRPAELWPALNILCPSKYPNFEEFAEKYCQPKWTPWGWQYRGAKNLPELHAELKQNCMIRLLKKDVLKDLPDKQIIVIPVDLHDPSGEYQKADQNLIAWLEKQSLAKANRAKRAESLVKFGYLKSLAGRLKLPSVIEWIDGFLADSGEKLLTFCTQREVINTLHERYAKISVKVDGSVKSHDREIAKHKFQRDPHCRQFLGNIRAAGVGLTLTASCNVFFTELDWTPGALSQAIDRTHRIGQKNKVTCFIMVAKGTIEEKLLQIIQEKQETLDAVLDGKESGMTELDVFSQLEKMYAKKRR